MFHGGKGVGVCTFAAPQLIQHISLSTQHKPLTALRVAFCRWTATHNRGREGPYNVNETAEESLEFGLPMPYERRRYLVGVDPEEFPGLQQIDSAAKIAGWGSSSS